MIPPRGAYTADRAAALAGVPLSTVRYWAKKEILVPSVSQRRVMLWSYPDLMGLRMIYWLRQEKQLDDQVAIPRTTMKMVRNALRHLGELDLELWTRDDGFRVAVDYAGNVHVDTDAGVESPQGLRPLSSDMLDLIRPFETSTEQARTRGPDLHKPRPQLRIIPGKLGGEPHVKRTRLETQALAALARRGLEKEKIYRLYPIADVEAIDQALDLEKQLRSNLPPTLAAA